MENTKLSSKAEIRYRYNQVQQLTQVTTLESDKTKIKYHTQESQ